MKPETSPGVFSVEIPADEDVYIGIVAPLSTDPVSVAFTSSIPAFPLTTKLKDLSRGMRMKAVLAVHGVT